MRRPTQFALIFGSTSIRASALRDPDHTLVAATKATITPEAVVFDGNWSQVYRGRINDQFEDFGKSKPAASKHDLRDAIEATLAGQASRRAGHQGNWLLH